MKMTKYARSMILSAMIFVAAPLAWVTLRAQQQAPALSALDYAEIGQLANRYAQAIDTCSNNGYDYADLYTADGTFTDYATDEGYAKKGLVRAHGREELARAAGGGTLRGLRGFLREDRPGVAHSITDARAQQSLAQSVTAVAGFELAHVSR